MQGIKKIIPAFAFAFTIMIALPTISSATALSVGQPWGEFLFGPTLLLGLGLAGAFLWVKRPQFSQILILPARKRLRR